MPHTDSITIAQAAELRGCSTDSIYREILLGNLPAETVGKLNFVRKRDLSKLPKPDPRGRKAKA